MLIPSRRPSRTVRRLRAVSAVLSVSLALAACGSSRAGATRKTSSGDPGSVSGSVDLVAYSTPKPAYAALIKAFQATEQGKHVTFTQSYGASGSQATSVTSGLPASVVNFSTSLDMDKVVKAGDVAASWANGPTNGMVTNSIVSFIVRNKNPKHIETWSDLVKPGISVITPNPFSSGSAKWNLVAAYGAELALGSSKTQATAYLTQFLKHTTAQPDSASNALQTFLSGQGDVLVDYEDDALYAQRHGEPISVVTPPETILIQNPIAVTTHGSSSAAAKAFDAFLLSPAGQNIWGQQGYRPVLPNVAAQFTFPTPQKIFTIASLGGWTNVNTTFFNPETGVVAKIEQGLGVSTSSG